MLVANQCKVKLWYGKGMAVAANYLTTENRDDSCDSCRLAVIGGEMARRDEKSSSARSFTMG